MKRPYPVNLLSAIRLNEICGTAMDYATLIADQQAGLANLLDQLTERERFVLDKHYREGASMKALADQHHVNENRIRQIIRHAVKKCQVKELLLYVADGFAARTNALTEQAAQAERLYCQHLSMEGVHLYRLEAGALDLPVKVLHTLDRAGVHAIRDLVILSQYEAGLCRIRMLGAASERQIITRLQSAGLLPAQYERIPGCPCCMKPDRELATFRNLTRFADN